MLNLNVVDGKIISVQTEEVPVPTRVLTELVEGVDYEVTYNDSQTGEVVSTATEEVPTGAV